MRRIILREEIDEKILRESHKSYSVSELLNKGLINLDKPPGPTSHEIVAWIKKILKVKKAGHAGTLEPYGGDILR